MSAPVRAGASQSPLRPTVVDGAAQPVGGEAQGTVRLRDPEEEAAEDVGTAESAEPGERLKAARSRRSRPATAT